MVRCDLAERLCFVEAVRASDAREYRRNLAAVETRLEEERASRARTEADLANQKMGRQAMEGALDGKFTRTPFF